MFYILVGGLKPDILDESGSECWAAVQTAFFGNYFIRVSFSY